MNKSRPSKVKNRKVTDINFNIPVGNGGEFFKNFYGGIHYGMERTG